MLTQDSSDNSERHSADICLPQGLKICKEFSNKRKEKKEKVKQTKV